MAKTPETPPIYMRRKGTTLVPEFKHDADMIAELSEFDRIRVDLRTGRSPSKLRFYFQMLRKLIQATDCAPNTEALHAVIKLDLGHANPVRLANGMTVLVPASVAFDKMSEEDFGIYLGKAIEWVARNYGVTPEQLMDGERAA